MRHLDGNTSLLPSESVDGVEGDESTLSEPGRIGVNNIISKIHVQCIIYLEIVTLINIKLVCVGTIHLVESTNLAGSRVVPLA